MQGTTIRGRPQRRKVLDAFEELEGGQHVTNTEGRTPEDGRIGAWAGLTLSTHSGQEKP